MNSIDNNCNKLKWDYDSCFYNWLNNYVEESKSTGRKYPEGYVPCEELFKPYQACVSAALKERNIELSQTESEIQQICKMDIEQAKAELEKNEMKN